VEKGRARFKWKNAEPIITTNPAGTVTMRHLSIEKIELSDGDKMSFQEMIAARFLEGKSFKLLEVSRLNGKEFLVEVEQ
jgi:hypothetical protein